MPPRELLLTGATGFLEASLVDHPASVAVRAHCLVRAPDRESAQHRIAEALAVPADLSDLRTAYAQTKWVSEHLVAQAAARGLPATICRPGETAGVSTAGAWNTGSLL
ncbi:SDR family oxidoreductase [Streptoalloteichus hindustanus]|uniref:SDR family oxidoreductase n=1 Tax=Streptoalloteichus hindustanus TaxID=2017 RepID=UPI000937104F|nr:SDR family oxidoreductase [Streptoalloteichus hindustanus]